MLLKIAASHLLMFYDFRQTFISLLLLYSEWNKKGPGGSMG